jgi:thiol-disulfide isomerase/thioredoxin
MREFRNWLIVAGLLAVAACGKSDSAGPIQVQDYATGALSKLDLSAAGSPAPTIPFESRNGKVMPADFKGKVVVLNLWATWCAPCVKELPSLDTLQSKFSNNDAQVLLVSQDAGGWDAVDKKWASLKMQNLETHLDQDMSYIDAFKAPGLPLTVIYNRDGKEVGRIMKDVAWDGPDATKLITALVGKKS